MMLGDIAHWQEEKHLYPPAVQRGIEYILATDFTKLPDGKYEIDGDRLFALLQTPTLRPAELQRPESHQVYTDIQFVLDGCEQIGVARKNARQLVSDNRFEDQDVAFYSEVHGESELRLQSGMFVVFLPTDIHRPCCTYEGEEGPARKVVVKIHRNLF